MAELERQSGGLACSDSMGPNWQLWSAALHALAAMPEAQARLLLQDKQWKMIYCCSHQLVSFMMPLKAYT